jgi:hypothetical protein
MTQLHVMYYLWMMQHLQSYLDGVVGNCTGRGQLRRPCSTLSHSSIIYRENLHITFPASKCLCHCVLRQGNIHAGLSPMEHTYSGTTHLLMGYYLCELHTHIYTGQTPYYSSRAYMTACIQFFSPNGLIKVRRRWGQCHPQVRSQLRLQRQTRTHGQLITAATSPLLSLASRCISGQPISTTCHMLTG